MLAIGHKQYFVVQRDRKRVGLAQHGAQAAQDRAGKGSFYQASGGLVVLSCGRVDTGKISMRTKQDRELSITDPNCQPNDTPDPSSFNWITLHEIGHTVDDKQSFMNGKAGSSKYGGWHDYGNDVSKVANAIHGECGYDETWIKDYLLKKSRDEPPPGDPANQLAWNAERDAAKTWCDAIREGNKVWMKQGVCAARTCTQGKHNGRVYHQAYGGRWVSYEFAARARGVTGYQFRAPGEWFAELYAAYATKKMNEGHPDHDWIFQRDSS